MRVLSQRVGIDRGFAGPRLTKTVGMTVLVAFLVYVIVAPLGTVIWAAFRDAGPGLPSAFTLDNLTRAVNAPAFSRALGNTLVFGIGASLVAFSLGGYLAWVTERTNVPARGIIYVFVLVPLIVPGILTAIAWNLVLNPTIGIANELLATLFQMEEPVFNAYSLPAMIWANGTDSITLPFLFMAAAFRTMDPSLEEASLMAGADTRSTVRRITLPILAPAMVASFLLVFIRAVEDFNVPAAMGIPGGVHVFASVVWLSARRSPVDFNLAATYGIMYLLVALVGVGFYYYFTRVGERFITVRGKSFRPTRIQLRGSRYIHSVVALLILVVSVILPFAVMVYASLLPYYQVPTMGVWDELTTQHFQWALSSGQGRGALWNNIKVGIPAALAATFLGLVVSWIGIRTRLRGRRLLDLITFTPIAIPGIVMGLAFLWFFLTFPILPIYGTLWIIGVAFIAKYVPYAVRSSHASLGQLHAELEEASTMSGAGWLSTLWRVVMPLISGGLLISFIYVLSLTFKVLSLPVLLAGPRTPVLSVLVLDLYQNGEYARLNAVGVVMVVVLVVLFGMSRAITRKLGSEVQV